MSKPPAVGTFVGMATLDLIYEVENGLAWITINRPEARNALDDAHYHALADAFSQAEARDDVAVVALTGTQDAFCAGQDLGEMGRLGDPSATTDNARRDHGFTRFVGTLESFPKPLTAAFRAIR